MTHRRESVVRARYQSGMMIINVEDLIWDIVHMPVTAQNQTQAADNRTGTFAKFFDLAVHNVQPSRNEWMCSSHETAPASVCVSFLSTVMVMTSNTNPLDWDYSSSRAAAGRREAEDWTSLACLPVSFFCDTGSMTSSVRFPLSFYQRHQGGIFHHRQPCFYI